MNRTATFLLPAVTALLAACSGSSSASPQHHGGGSPFGESDLAGDWTGVFVPSNPARDSFNFYVRFDESGAGYEGADALGDQWRPADSRFNTTVDKRGNALVNLEQSAESGVRMRLLGILDGARAFLNGDFELIRPLDADVQGHFEIHRSGGAGQFDLALLEGTWLGYGAGMGNHRKDVRMELGADGSLLSGDMEVHRFVPGGVNTGIFQFSNSAVGRIDNVLIQSTDGSFQMLDFVLVNAEGTLFGGPGSDSALGAGLARMARQP